MELPLVFGFSFVAVVFFCYFYIILHIFDMFFSAPQFAMQSQMRSKRTESMNLNWFKEQRGRTKWMEMKCMVNKTALNRNWHACQPVARTQQKSGRAKESESGERERLGVVIIIIFSNSTFAISLHTAEICINYTVRPWVMILFELVALIHSLFLSLIRLLLLLPLD